MGNPKETASLDAWQRAALAECTAPCRVSVLGAPGTGKTAFLGALVAREAMASQGRIAVITLDRRAAGALYDSISMEMGALSGRIGVRTLTAFAYSIVQEYAQAIGRKDPELISGPEEDVLLAAILADPQSPIEFPGFVTEELRNTRGFRAQIRDLLTRASELGYSSNQLERLGRRLGEPMWVAGAHILDLYEAVTAAQDALAGASHSPDRLDHARLVGAAAAMLRNWDANVSAEPGFPRFSRPRWDWVLVDDIHNAPGSILALLAELAADGASIVVTGDPDASVQGFRGALASLPGDVTRLLGCRAVPLRQRHRSGKRIGSLADRIAQAIRVGGGAIAQRGPDSGVVEDCVEGRRFVHEEEEIAWIAHALREAHLDGVRYSDMAVMTRSRNAHPGIRASLVRRGIPVGQIGTDRPLREEPAVAALLDLVRLAIGVAEGGEPGLRAVLTGPLIGIDPLRLRKIGRILRGCELAAGGGRLEDELLSVVFDGPEAVEALAPTGVEELVRAARVFARIRQVHGRSRQAEEVLWAAWDATGVAERWREAAVARGVAADAADSALDAVIQLFRVAQRMADRNAEATIEELMSELQAQDLPQDSIARSGSGVESVTLTTPSASIGREWEIVVVARLQDGLWPNMRLRDVYTHTSRLTRVASGREVDGMDAAETRREAFEDVVDDELRQLHHAVTRAGRRLVFTCVDSEDARPSRFFDLMGFVGAEDADGIPPDPRRCETDDPRPRAGGRQTDAAESGLTRNGEEFVLLNTGPLPQQLDAAELIAALRQSVLAGDEKAVGLLRELARAGFVQADSGLWPEAMDVTSVERLPKSAEVKISPSRVETLLACPLRGFLSGIGGEPSDDRRAAEIGTLVHSIAERHPDGTKDELMEAFEQAWRSFPATPGFAEMEHDRVADMVALLAAYLSDYRRSGAAGARVENPVRVSAGEGIVLSGKIDRIEPTSKGLRIVDFKTASVPVTKREAQDSIQLRLYQWALERVEGEGGMAGAALVYLGKASGGGPVLREQSPLNGEGREQAFQLILDAAELLRGGEFAAVASEANCRTCRFAGVCPARNEGRMFS